MSSEPTDEESSGKKKQLDPNDNEASRLTRPTCEESTEGEEDDDDVDDDDTDDDDSDLENAQNGPSQPCSVNENENLLMEMCMSPPKYDRMSKRSKKQTRSDKARSGKGGAKTSNRSRSKGKSVGKRPALVNSAENIDKTELAKNTYISEKLNELQEQRKVNESGSVSAPATATIKTSPSSGLHHFPALHLAPSDSDLNPLDRRDRKDKTQKLLELALKSNNQTNNSQTLYKQQKQSFFSVATATAFAVAAQASAHLDENHKKHLNNNIWKELYDFFDHNNDRAKNLNEIELRLRAERAKIPPKIDNIKQTSFGFIKKVMNKEIANIKTPIGYSSLYENKNYIDQLCYLYYLVEDLINEIGAIENLYPSIEALRKDQPSYADKNFEATIKTLILWYKLIINLMNKSDILGKILGFRKNKEYADYWTWFDQRLNYSKNEFQYVQKWLSDNVETSLPQISSESTITSLVDIANVTSMTSTTQTTPTASTYGSNQHPIYSPSISVTRPSNQNLVEIATQYQRLQQQPQTRIDRQISFTIKSNNSNTNLLYNNFGTSDIGSNQDLSSNATYGHNGIEDDMSHLSLATSLSTSSVTNSNNSNNLSQDTQQPLLNPEQLASQLLKSSNEQNEHLKSAKLFHLSSFIASRSSSYKSTGSQSPLSPSIYKSLIDLQDEHESNTANQSTDGDDARVIFTISGEIAPNHNYAQSSAAGDPTTAEYLMNAAAGENNTELNKKRETILSEFLRKRLRKCGLTKTFNDLRDVLLDTLFDTLQALQIDRCERYTLTGCDDHFYYHLMPLHHKCKEFISKYTLDDETMAYGVKCDTYKRLDLPSFRPLYLYLCSVLIELMHLCIRMQIENKKDIKVSKDYKFSLLSTEVLTNECRECIEQSILIRQLYYHMIFSVFDRTELDVQSALEADLVKFDEDLKEIINIYLNFITNWVQDLVSNSDLSKALWVLNDEWKFCKNNLYFVTASEDIYAKRFCTMTCFINGRLQHNLNDIDSKFKQPIMEYISNMKMKEDMGNYDMENSLMHSSADALETQLNKNTTDSQQLNDGQEYNDEEYELAGSEMDGNGELDDTLSQNEGENINLKCNEFKDEINQMRKYAMKALGFCGKLINDLELAARYEVRSSIQELLDELKTSNHVLIIFTNPELNSSYSTTPESSASSFDHLINNSPQSFMIFVPQEFSKEKLQIIRLLFIISEKDEFDSSANGNLKNSLSLNLFSSSSSSSLPTNRPVGLDSTDKNLFNDTVFKKNPKQKAPEPAPKTIPFRRLSSSNSVIEMSVDSQAKAYLNKLSKLANIDCQEDQAAASTSAASASTSSSNQDPVSAFIISPNTNTKKDGYLLFLQLTKTPKPDYKWTGPTIQLYASTPVRNSLYKHKSILNSPPTPKLILVTPKQSVLNEKRTELKQKLRGTISLIKEKTSFHPNIEYAIDELKDSILNLRKESVECIKSIENDLSLHYEAETKCIGNSIIDQRYLSELWRVSYNFGIELQNECIKFMTQDRAETFSLDLAEFAILWCEYIVNKTDRGKGRTVRPWAANKGIQLLQEAVAHSDNLNDLTFIRLIKSVQECILHVIGDRNTGRLSAGSEAANLHNHNLMRASHSMIDSRQLETSRETSTHIVSAGIGDHPNMSVPQFGIDNNCSLLHEQTHTTVTRSSSVASKKFMRESPKNRFNKQCADLDKQRQEKLIRKRFIGRIHEVRRPDYILNTTEVSFRWQLGLLIGEGQFGKVYSCVNLDTGEPMALKKIQFKANDTKQVQSIADEINNVQGIEHENLVKFYGAELHRKEILIFMEFCGDQSTLNRIARDASGLPEKIVRDYTKSLLKAVECLHENNIMHRDIKGANIFLKTIDPYHPERTVLKLGDFGCSIKFKDPIDPSNKERATGFMGTFAFMAPEVMACGGALDVKYDVPADIWSLGCVVIEMFTGKHPWHPLSDEKILYMVHIEAKMLKPPYPSDISDEASNFLDSCLENKPNQRLTADKLLDHSFVKVPVHEDRYSSI